MSLEPQLQEFFYLLDTLKIQCGQKNLPSPKVYFKTPKLLAYQHEPSPLTPQEDGSWLMQFQDYALHGYAGVMPEVWREEINQLDLGGHTALSDFIDMLAQRSRELAYHAYEQGKLSVYFKQNDELITQLYELLLRLRKNESLNIKERIYQELGINVSFNHDHGIWQSIPKEQQTYLSESAGLNCHLGGNAILGSRYLETSQCVQVVLSTQDSDKEQALHALLEKLIEPNYHFEIKINH